MGRAANTRVLFISQRPSAELFGDIRDQLSVRILMGNPVNAETYKMALGENRNNSDIITRKFREGFINYDGEIEDFKAPNILSIIKKNFKKNYQIEISKVKYKRITK